MHLLILGGSPNHLGGMEAMRDRSVQALLERDDWDVRLLPTNTAYLKARSLPVLLSSLAKLVHLRFRRPDAVWLNYVNLPDLLFLGIARILGFRVIVTPHLGSTARSQADAKLRRLSCWLLGFANGLALLARTQELEVDLPVNVKRWYIKTFLPATIIKGKLEGRQASSELRLLHASRLSELKGTFAFVRVCEHLKKNGVSFTASIAGGADEQTFRRLHSAIAECGLTDHIRVLGHRSDADMRSLLLSSDVLVHLSMADSYPLVVLEALACGAFPLCTDLLGARDMITTYDGHLVSREQAVEEAAAFLSSVALEEIARRSAAVAERVRVDYEWGECASLLGEALRASVRRNVSVRPGLTPLEPGE